MADAETAYNNSHRAFLQAFMARSVMTFEEAQHILADILSIRDETRPVTPADISEADLSTYIATLNASLSPLDYEIRSTQPQTPSPTTLPPRIYVLVNTTSDPHTQLATTHTPDEIAFLKRLLDAMFETHNTRRAEVLALTTTQALNLHKAPPRSRESLADPSTQASQSENAASSLTMPQAQKALDDLVAEGWLDLSPRSYLSLSARSLMELRGWLLETYNDAPDSDASSEAEYMRVKMCEMCRDIVTVGQRCANRDCRCRLHDACVRQCFRGGQQRCPVCRTEWTGEDFVGERAAGGKAAAAGRSNGRASNAGVGSSSRRRGTGYTVIDDDDEE